MLLSQKLSRESILGQNIAFFTWGETSRGDMLQGEISGYRLLHRLLYWFIESTSLLALESYTLLNMGCDKLLMHTLYNFSPGGSGRDATFT